MLTKDKKVYVFGNN